jgi:hypothetical protein
MLVFIYQEKYWPFLCKIWSLHSQLGSIFLLLYQYYHHLEVVLKLNMIHEIMHFLSHSNHIFNSILTIF